ncbi:ATP-dependent RNA helicase DeaD [Ketogulonicigenium robustum]|uniref:ATP-dependent RNA helicase DeaD n=2 Tax=Ketogulonicigenium robustum TaxID=92947 RepID=A0A1W6NZP2_9RHOB|nr:ATP-dependent RNA helicase DeaD [Ketogulonicigenium robustum]
MNIPAPLAAALAEKGYASLTAVQTAAIAPETTGRDLLVSAQTGSGKTVAFGLGMARDILGDSDKLSYAPQPLALAIAPTRELALQVARELEWLYGQAGAVIATCVGGMDYRTERRALERGAHIVVGTPGRLRDHIDRGSLDLTGLRVAVLDEADEMLDLGFREDLEYILNAAPEDRRTLLFSATVPSGIAALARDFQKDALRLVAGGEARQHVDISYQALSVTVRDRDNAIFNLLRFHEAQRAIIFCKTRANVNHLLARMGNRGFKVVALSGELSQAERSHALQALRDGRAQVCIATDVAARGIDLPGLELVIHADLPTNPETLLHRSGRTGRAGSKGVSALIVTPADYKKAQRILRAANVEAEWGKAPGADDVAARDDQRMFDDAILNAPAGEESGIAATLLDRFGADHLAAAFVRLWRSSRPTPEELSEVAAPRAPSEPRARSEFGASQWFRLSAGHVDRAEARWLLPKICDGGAITRDDIGAIRIRENDSFVQIAVAAAPRFGDTMELAPGLIMTRHEGDIPEGRGTPAPRPARKPAAPRRSEFTSARPPREDYAPRDQKPSAPRAAAPEAVEGAAPKTRIKARWSEADKAGRKDRADAPRYDPDAVRPYKARTGAKPAGKPGAKPPFKAAGKTFGAKGAKPAPRSARPGGFDRPKRGDY